LFYDGAHGITDVTNFDVNREFKFEQNYWSTGAELWFDFNFMRLQPLLSGGVRAVYIPDGGLSFEIVIGNIGI
jgi:hypothetical protein